MAGRCEIGTREDLSERPRWAAARAGPERRLRAAPTVRENHRIVVGGG